ncbi:DUF5723 family protein [soil metagenome]
MNKFLRLFSLLLCLIVIKSNAQIFPGTRTSNYNGVNGVFFNPANIADNRYKWDINIISVNGFVGNNQNSLGFKDITRSFNSDSLKSKLLRGDKPNLSALITADVFGPSFMFNTKSGSAFAITTRSRVFSNASGIDGALARGIIDGGANNGAPYPQTFNSYANSKINTVGWSEFGLSYATILTKKDSKNFFKAGVTVKYLAGTTNSYVRLQNLDGTINYGPNGTFLGATTGAVSINTTGADFTDYTIKDFFKFNGHGLGGDVGLVYELRPPSMTQPDTIYMDNNFRNKYKLKIAVGVVDIGRIRFSKDDRTSATYNVNIPAGEQFLLSQFDGKSVSQYKAVLDNSEFFTPTSSVDSKYSITLPTTFQADIDYNIGRRFYAALSGQVGLTKNNDKLNLYNYNSVSLTPRYEAGIFGVAVPLNYNELTKFNAGVSFRIGPVFFGSGSVITALFDNSKQADGHIGFRFGIPYKKHMRPDTDKDGVFDNLDQCPTVAGPAMYHGCPDTDGDGIIDSLDKCPSVAGLERYQGCPIPDTDKDGINDEVDKCPSVAGLERYQGCPIPDKDNDGINDEEDKCPDVPGIAKYFGCPIPDRDKDGVNDDEDLCPDEAGPALSKGCPEQQIAVEITAEFKNILFDFGKATIRPESMAIIQKAAQTMNEQIPNSSLYIDGYTDSKGSVKINKSLSLKRAQAVTAALAASGVDKSRINARGFGKDNPKCTNDTEEGRQCNRRVEVVIQNINQKKVSEGYIKP